MNLPNKITIMRIILIPIYLLVFYSSMENRLLIAGLIFLLAGISDLLDGYIARKYDLTTDLGAVLDPFADKLMSFAVLISFTTMKLIPIWVLIALGIKEVFMIIGSAISIIYHKDTVVHANNYGKFATISFYIAILSVVFKINELLSTLLLIITVTLNILAFYKYLRIFLTQRENKNIQHVDKQKH